MIRVRRLVVDVDHDSDAQRLLEAGGEVELMGMVWRPHFMTQGREGSKVWELRAIRAQNTPGTTCNASSVSAVSPPS